LQTLPKILITGGCGFLGNFLSLRFRSLKYPVTVFDNLKRRGSEMNLAGFKKSGIDFHHGDIRNAADWSSLKQGFDYIIHAASEPSVYSGILDSRKASIETNFLGTVNCLEFASEQKAKVVFISTSRVFSIEALRGLPLQEGKTRFDLAQEASGTGWSYQGFKEDFSTDKSRSLYGACKLSSEMLIQEYANFFQVPSIINRCGVLAGPGQFGRTDQGVYTLWVARHFYGIPLKFTGFGGTGKQVRDILHPEDLFRLILKQMDKDVFNGETFHVAGGRSNSVSLLEYTELCQRILDRKVEITSVPESSSVDVPYVVLDSTKVKTRFDWDVQVPVEKIVEEIKDWLKSDPTLQGLF